jgi:apolipoprotein N-acyltransferase
MAMNLRWPTLWALAAGAALPFGFAPFGLWPLAIVAPTVLFTLWVADDVRGAVWHGLVFGAASFAVGVSWVYFSMHDFGNMSPPLAGLAVALFVLFLALYPAVAGWVQARAAGVNPGLRFVVIMPAVWILLEWLRGWLFSGFPWLALGYSQTDTALAGLAPWLGVYGVGLAAAVSAGALAWLLNAPAAWKRPVAVVAVVWIAAFAAGRTSWVEPSGGPMRVALVQGNVPLAMKWSFGARQAIVNRYIGLSQAHADSDLIVWPEAAIPAFVQEFSDKLWARLRRITAAHGAELVFGVLERNGFGANASTYNSVMAIGSERQFYRKHHLVPFGEYPALPWITRWLMASLDIPMSDLSAWDAPQAPMRLAGREVGVTICYEDAFPQEVLRSLPAATLLLNVSEDAWFGDSLGPHQRLQMARMRALESGRPMLRAANTGVSAVIDDHGEVVAQTPQFVTDVLVAKVQPMQGATPYVRVGNWAAIGLAVLMLAGGGLAVRRNASRHADVDAEDTETQRRGE